MRSPCGSWRWCATVSSLLLLANRTNAQPAPKQTLDLKYEVDPALQGCPSVTEFRAIIAQQLGYDPYRSGSKIGVDVHVRPSGNRIEGTIKWDTALEKGAGERHFEARSEDCVEMMTTVGFVVAVQIQLMATEVAAEPTLPPAVPEASPTERPLNSPNSTGRPFPSSTVTLTADVFKLGSRSATDWSAILGIGPAIGVGLGPHPIFLGRVFSALRLGPAEVEVGMEASLPAVTHQPYGAGFRHELRLGTLAVCGWYMSLSACWMAKVGRVQVQGFGVDKPESPKGLAAQSGPRLAYSVGLSDHTFLLGHVEALYLFTPWNIALNRVAVWTMPRLGSVAGIDLAVRFW